MKSGVYLSPDGHELLIIIKLDPFGIFIKFEHQIFEPDKTWQVEYILKDWHYLGDL